MSFKILTNFSEVFQLEVVFGEDTDHGSRFFIGRNKIIMRNTLFSFETKIILLVIVCTISSCGTIEKNDSIIVGSIDEGLKNSSKNISSHNIELLKAIENNLTNIRSYEKAAIWQPKSQQIKKESTDLISYLEDHRDGLENSKTWDNLYKRINMFKQNLLNVDPELKKIFINQVNKITIPFDSIIKTKQSLSEFFNQTSMLTRQTFLSKLQNNVILIENSLLTFCFEKTVSNYDGFFITSVLIGQNKSYFRDGEELKITAGVGAYSAAAQPKVSIDGEQLQLKDNATAEYRLKVSGNVGKHNKQVKIDYMDQDGMKQSKTYTIEYIIEN